MTSQIAFPFAATFTNIPDLNGELQHFPVNHVYVPSVTLTLRLGGEAGLPPRPRLSHSLLLCAFPVSVSHHFLSAGIPRAQLQDIFSSECPK